MKPGARPVAMNAPCVGGGDGLDGGGGNLVRLEADQRAVYVKEYRFCHILCS